LKNILLRLETPSTATTRTILDISASKYPNFDPADVTDEEKLRGQEVWLENLSAEKKRQLGISDSKAHRLVFAEE
jgi:hypothetical protein